MIRSKDPSAEQPEECEALHPQSISARIVPISALPDKLASIFGSTASAKPVNDEKNFGNGLAASVKPTGLSGKAVRMQVSSMVKNWYKHNMDLLNVIKMY